MKKLIVMASLLLGAMFTANAQDSEGLGLDVKVGADIASMSSSSSTSSREGSKGIGFGLSAAYNISISEKYIIAPGLGYTSLKIEEANLSQIQIPVTLKYVASEKISGLAGVKYGMFMDKDIKTALDKSANLSAEVGGNYALTEKIFAEVKYAIGLTDFGGAKLNGILISVGYKL